MLNFNRTMNLSYQGINYSFPTCKFEGHDVIVASGCEYLIAAVILIPYSHTVPLIMVSEQFVTAPESFQRFFLYHEIGHIVNRHIKMDEGALDRTTAENEEAVRQSVFNRVNQKEIDERELVADLYSANIVGFETAIESLELTIDSLERGLEELELAFIPPAQEERIRTINTGSIVELKGRISYLKQCLTLKG